ncbi:uncharacterized protein LOC131153269 isoform X2 [Malania oleifera]|uniref:uncharacterized protein LOC131153269 isoform X2 n=1 Tax=Malania oleifera TaxID=397392 RepID=UPI0025AE83CB|nr:uncharacterized protein LOC131153269 isoform X2 [Malania oleifera]
MVIAGATEEEENTHNSMAMGPERSKPLHNFSMGCLKWGNQRFLRCVKIDSEGAGPAVGRRSPDSGMEKSLVVRRREGNFQKPGSLHCSRKSPSPAAEIENLRKGRVEGDGDDGIEAVRTKLLLDLQEAVDKMNFTFARGGKAVAEESAPAARPWNLRSKRAAWIGGDGGGEKTLTIDDRGRIAEKKERRNLTVQLSRQEVEEDYYAILGQRPPRRPKKRAKIVQNQMDAYV